MDREPPGAVAGIALGVLIGACMWAVIIVTVLGVLGDL